MTTDGERPVISRYVDVEKIRQRIAKLEEAVAEYRELSEFLEWYEGSSLAGTTVARAIGARGRSGVGNGVKQLGGRELADAAVAVIADAGGSLDTSEVLDGLARRGLGVTGKTPPQTLYSALKRVPGIERVDKRWVYAPGAEGAGPG